MICNTHMRCYDFATPLQQYCYAQFLFPSPRWWHLCAMSVFSGLFTKFKYELRALLLILIISLLTISTIWYLYDKKIHVVEEKIKHVTNGKK